jgi:hypothetical protein
MGSKVVITDKVYIEFVDGVPVRIPVDATFISEGVYQILPHTEFDYEDDSVLFEFGEGDIVRVKAGQLADEKQVLRAYELMESGDQRNFQKRLLLYILMKEITPLELLQNVGRNDISALKNKIEQADFMYPSIKEWLTLHGRTIQHLLNGGF